ncbi:MAG: hypothetical protein KJZ59_03385, partial [Pararhodobacter sp.]|nr:hypothetical protein [Pararhodobacter sp.]
MDDTLSTVMGLSAGAAVLAVLLALVAHTIRRERRIRAGLQEFAQQRGLRLDDQRRAGRRAARIVL